MRQAFTIAVVIIGTVLLGVGVTNLALWVLVDVFQVQAVMNVEYALAMGLMLSGIPFLAVANSLAVVAAKKWLPWRPKFIAKSVAIVSVEVVIFFVLAAVSR